MIRAHDPNLARYLRAYWLYRARGSPGKRPRCTDYHIGWQSAALARWIVDAALDNADRWVLY